AGAPPHHLAFPPRRSSDLLMKYDTAGRLAFTRVLGAASEASGYALSVADDGRVAVAGSVTGALEPGASGVKPGVSDSFVTVFDEDRKSTRLNSSHVKISYA